MAKKIIFKEGKRIFFIPKDIYEKVKSGELNPHSTMAKALSGKLISINGDKMSIVTPKGSTFHIDTDKYMVFKRKSQTGRKVKFDDKIVWKSVYK